MDGANLNQNQELQVQPSLHVKLFPSAVHIHPAQEMWIAS